MSYRDDDADEILHARWERAMREADALSRRLDRERPKRLPLLAGVRIASPCDERWEDMHGDERARHCVRCERTVFDLSAHTSREAEELLRAHGVDVDGGPCLRLWRRADGTVITRDCPVGLRRELGDRARTLATRALVGGLLTAPVVMAGALVLLPVMGRLGPLRQARRDVRTVRFAAEMYLAENSGAACPTIDDLVETRILNSSARTTDPWGNPFVIRCHEHEEIEVTSRELARSDLEE